MAARWVRYVFLAALVAAVFLPSAAYAACTGPAGTDGVVMYNGDAQVPQYCNGVNWVPMTSPINLPTTNGLVGYWKLDEGSGTSVADSSGNGNTGTVGAGAALTTGGYYNGAASFPGGSNNYVSLPDTAALDFAGSWTLSAWVNNSNLPGSAGNAFIINRDNNVSKTAYVLEIDHHQGCPAAGQSWRVSFQDSGGTQHMACYAATINTGTWYHVVGVWDASAFNLMIYVNGTLDVTQNTGASVPVITSGSGLRVGSDGGGTSRWNGVLDDVRLYNRVLSAAEITTLYNWHVSPPSSGLAGRWKFDESGGTTASDSSGNVNNGTLTNGPTFTSAGKLAGALTLNGTTQYVSVPSASSLNLSTFTLSAWVKFSSVSTGHSNTMLEKATNAGNDNYFMLFSASNQLNCGFTSSGTFYQYSVAWTPTAGNWYHVACTYDGAQIVKYVNGAQLSSNAETHTPDTVAGSLDFGTSPWGNLSNYFTGTIDDARVYNRALSADEIYGLYRTSSPVCASPSGYEGDVIYNNGSNHVLQFCDNASWRPLGPVPGAGTGPGCSSPTGAEGNIIYSDSAKGSGVAQYCDGTNWILLGAVNLPTSGLVGYWKFDETSGTNAADSSGSGNAGTTHNAPTWTTSGHSNGTLTFNGTSQYVTAANAASLNLNNFSIAFWIKFATSPAGSNVFFVEKDDGTPNYNYEFYYASGNYLNCAYNTASSFGAVLGPSWIPSTNQWYHLACTYDGSNMNLYVNGLLVTSTPATGTPITASTSLSIGYVDLFGGTGFVSGPMDDVRIYNRALNQKEIWQLYNGT